MKGIKYIAMGALLATLPSCSHDWLDVEPETAVQTETSIKLLKDIEFTLNGTYSIMQNADAYSGTLMYYGDATGDDMQAVSSTKRTGNYYRFNWTKDSNPTSQWALLYSIITNCNVILNNVDKMDLLESEKEESKDLKGQAFAIRGLAYFDLMRIYGYPYKKDNGASLGVPIVTSELKYNEKPARSTVADCMEQVISDLKSACDLMDPGFKEGKITKWAAMCLLSRAYLYKGDDANAFATAKATIEGAEEEGYQLWTNKEYPTAWSWAHEVQGETLFTLINETTDSPGYESMGYLNSPEGYDDICLTRTFYNMLKEDPNDVRLKLVNHDEENEYAYINKYQPQDKEDISDADIPVVRLSEAYLIAAEAAVKLGNNADAVKYLNPIVQRANPENSVEGETITLERVKTEKRKEFVGEGHRMFDALRDGGQIVRTDAESGDVLVETEHFAMLDEPYDWNNYFVVLPIPTREMKANPNMKQNPGYGE